MAQLSPLLIAHPHAVSATGVQDFPLELIEHTIDHLHDDRVSLAACTVVCKSWTTPSHYHLFDTLRIIAGEDHQRLRQFADFIPSSKFACKGVRHVYLSHSSNDAGPSLTEFEGAASADFDVGLLTSLLDKMSRLQSLTISQTCWKEPSFPGILNEPKLHLPLLTKLTIGPLPFFHKIHHIQIVFDWFPSLRQLSMREGILVDPRIAMGTAFTYPVAQPLVLPTTLRLTTLSYYSFVYSSFFLESISGTLSTRSLRFISVRITSLQSVIGVGKLLRIVGPILEGLDLDLQFLFRDLTHINSVDRCMFVLSNDDRTPILTKSLHRQRRLDPSQSNAAHCSPVTHSDNLDFQRQRR